MPTIAQPFRILATAAVFAALAGAGQAAQAQAFDQGLPAGWTCAGNCGTAGADGDVPLAPNGGSQYGWVSTLGGVSGVSPFNISDTSGNTATSGSMLRSSTFSANAGDALSFDFDYITTDGGGYTDYAWARVLNASDLSQSALLFTARTSPGASSIPGFGLPAASATFTQTGVPVSGGSGQFGGPVWSPFSALYTGACYDTGCGVTGWVGTDFTFAQGGQYVLEFGVTNWADDAYPSGLAFDGIAITPVPEPATGALALAGLAGLAAFARRRKV